LASGWGWCGFTANIDRQPQCNVVPISPCMIHDRSWNYHSNWVNYKFKYRLQKMHKIGLFNNLLISSMSLLNIFLFLLPITTQISRLCHALDF
jgi:hypothetical protein